MPIGDPISEPIPPVGTAGTSYASQLVAFLTEVKARLEANVSMTSLLVGLLDMANNAIANVSYLSLYEQVSVPASPVNSLQVYGDELYFVSAAGAVRITNGGALDVVGANGITGDYAAPAEFRYDVGALEYFAYSNYSAAPKEWARIGAQGLDIYGTLTSTARVRIAWPGGANWTLTIPAAPPASQQLVQVEADGDLVFSNTIPEDVTLAANKNITLSGTGFVKHGEYSHTQVLAPTHDTTNFSGVNTPANGTTTELYYEIGTNGQMSVVVTAPLIGGKHRITAFKLITDLNNVPTVEIIRHWYNGPSHNGALTGSGDYTVTQVDDTVDHDARLYTLDTPLQALENSYIVVRIINTSGAVVSRQYALTTYFEAIP